MAKDDPYWLKARFAGTCAKCGKTIKKGDEAFYYPLTRKIFCQSPCGTEASADFNAHVFDEMANVW